MIIISKFNKTQMFKNMLISYKITNLKTLLKTYLINKLKNNQRIRLHSKNYKKKEFLTTLISMKNK